MNLGYLKVITLSCGGREATLYPSRIHLPVLTKSVCLQNIKSYALISNMLEPGTLGLGELFSWLFNITNVILS